MDTQTCSIYKENWIYKFLILFILIAIFSFSLYFYYTSLNKINHNNKNILENLKYKYE